MNYANLFESNARDFIKNHTTDPWVGTPFEGYSSLTNQLKGGLGENIVKAMGEANGITVGPRTSPGHDLTLNGKKVEVKFSLAHKCPKTNTPKENVWTINHLGLKKDWEILVFVGINKDLSKSVVRCITKETFLEMEKNGTLFDVLSRQQGGQDGNNDDYISTGKKLEKLLAEVKSINFEDIA